MQHVGPVKIAVVYYSGAGHTTKLAEAVAKGAQSIHGVQVELLQIKNEHLEGGRFKNEELMEKLDRADAIVFGSPTYMGGPAAQFKAFADATSERWFNRAWVDKIAAGFTISNGPSGDKLSTLQYFVTLAMQHGMIWVGLVELPFNDLGINRLSSYMGAMGQAGHEPPEVAPNEADKLTCEALGRRVAEVTSRWKRGKQ